MNNHISTRGTITYVRRRETSVFMTIKEEGRHGSSLVVKAFCPAHLKETPQVWANHFQFHDIGTRVVVEGCLSFDRETTQTAGTAERVPVKHPVTGRDIYEPFIWASSIDVLFDPAIHVQRSRAQHPAATRQPATWSADEPGGDDGLPLLPQLDAEPGRANVAWNHR